MHHPFAQLTGLQVAATAEVGTSLCTLTVTPALFNPQQVLHGAVLYAMADTGMGAALYPLLSEGELCATIEIKISYFAPVFDGTVACHSRLVNRGKRIAYLESELLLKDRLVARASGNFAIFQRSADG